MRTQRLLPFLALFLPLVLAAPLAAQADLGASVSFGDSLTHNDLLHLLSGLPRDMYGDDPFEAAFRKAAGPGDGLSSYAVGGSESQHLRTQIDLYDLMVLLGVEAPATLFNIEIGGNDFLNNRALLASAPPGVDPAADDVIDRLLVRLERDVRHLARKYRNADFVLWTIPDIVLTPDHWIEFDPVQTANLRAHLARANQAILSADRHPRIAVYDCKLVFDGLVAAPPVLFGHALIGPPALGGYDHLFADGIHPTAVHNAFQANSILQELVSEWGGQYPLYSERELADLAHIP